MIEVGAYITTNCRNLSFKIFFCRLQQSTQQTPGMKSAFICCLLLVVISMLVLQTEGTDGHEEKRRLADPTTTTVDPYPEVSSEYLAQHRPTSSPLPVTKSTLAYTKPCENRLE